MSKSAILAVRIIGDATGATKALKETETALDKLTPGAALAGGAAAAALTAGFVDAVSVEAGVSKMRGQLGLTEKEAARAGTVSAELFANGWGTGADQINEAVTSVIGNIDGMRTATDEQLSGVSQKVLSVANTFDQDLGATTTAVGQLMRTGMAKDATEALDIITAGLQGNARSGEDLLDTFTEYPALFQRLGIDGQSATGLIQQGMAAGARSTDLVADALKEFQIRATDGSTASAEGFRALGIDAAAMTAQIAAGGDGAAAGLDQVLDALRGMEDPVARNAAAVALFGTQAEDLGGALFALDPSGAVEALGKVGGAASELGDTINDNAATTITTFTRQVQTSFQEVAANAIPVIEPVIALLTQFAPILGPLAVVIAAVSGAILVANGVMKAWAVVQGIATAAQWASNAAWLANPITWIVLAVIAAIALLIAAIVLVVQNWDTIAAKAAEVWSAVIGWIQGAIEWVQVRVVAAVMIAAAIWTNIKNAATAAFQAVIGWIQNAIQWVQVRIIQAVIGAAAIFSRISAAASAAFGVVIGWVQNAVGWIRDQIGNAVQGALSWFFSLRDNVTGVFQTIINWVQTALSWLRDLASNAVPGWAQDLLGMRSFSMPITPEIAPLSAPLYQARMAVTPVMGALAAPAPQEHSVAAAAPMLRAQTLKIPTPRSSAAAAPAYTDNREQNFHFPNYTGDRSELINWIREALRRGDINSSRIITA